MAVLLAEAPVEVVESGLSLEALMGLSSEALAGVLPDAVKDFVLGYCSFLRSDPECCRFGWLDTSFIMLIFIA